MMLGIHPEFLLLLGRLARGERVIWYPPLQWLFCFGKAFTGDPNRHVTQYVGKLFFDLMHPYDTRGVWSHDVIVGVKFWGFHDQLIRSDYLVSLQDKDGNIPALAVLEDIISWCTKHAPENFKEEYRDPVRIARAFLEKEEILIPSSEWMRALTHGKAHH